MRKAPSGRAGTLVIILLGSLLITSLATIPAHAKGAIPHGPILIDGNKGFTSLNGVTGGSGTLVDPYLIEGWTINASTPNAAGIEVRNTTASFIIRNVVVDSFCQQTINRAFCNVGIQISNTTFATVQNTETTNSQSGIIVSYSKNVTLSAIEAAIPPYNRLFDIDVEHSRNVTLSDSRGRLDIHDSENVRVKSNRSDGIRLGRDSNLLVDANINDNRDGILVGGTNNTSILNNTVCCGFPAIAIYTSINMTVTGNTISNSDVGVEIGDPTPMDRSIGIKVYHNNFFNNTVQVRGSVLADVPGPFFPIVWDAGYPTGGNYFSDYKGVDECMGPEQNICTGPDGIGDTPYVASCPQTLSSCEPIVDRYPLRRPLGSPPLSSPLTIVGPALQTASYFGSLTLLVAVGAITVRRWNRKEL